MDERQRSGRPRFPELDLEPFSERDEQIAREDAVTQRGQCLVCGKDAAAHRPGCDVETRLGPRLFAARYPNGAQDHARLLGWTYYESAGAWFALDDGGLFNMPACEPDAAPDWGNAVRLTGIQSSAPRRPDAPRSRTS